MEEKWAILLRRIILLAPILIIVIAVHGYGNGRERSAIGVMPDSVPSEAPDRPGIEDSVSAAEADPLDHALRKGLPVVADFGRSTCVPCKKMLPVLEKLQHDLEGKASILVIDIREYDALSRKHKIRVIPTQIFFNAAGEEVFRHYGFMPEEDIIRQLKKTGME